MGRPTSVRLGLDWVIFSGWGGGGTFSNVTAVKTSFWNVFEGASYFEHTALRRKQFRLLNEISRMALLAIVVYMLRNIIPTFTKSVTYLYL
jgi:hypothetical protein